MSLSEMKRRLAASKADRFEHVLPLAVALTPR